MEKSVLETVIYEVRDYSLAANGITEDFVPAASFRVLEATGALGVAFGGAQHFQRIESGLSVRMNEPFNSVRIKDLSGGANTVRVAYAGKGVEDSRLVLSSSGLSITKPSTLESTADVTLVAATKTLVKAADTARRSIVIGNLTGADLRYGDTDIGAARGDIIPAGGKGVIATTDAIYAYSVPGGDITILETKD